MVNKDTSDLALELLKVMAFVIPAVALIIAFIGRVKEESQRLAIAFALLAFLLAIVATMLISVFVVYELPTFYWSVAFFLASLGILVVSLVILVLDALKIIND